MSAGVAYAELASVCVSADGATTYRPMSTPGWMTSTRRLMTKKSPTSALSTSGAPCAYLRREGTNHCEAAA